MEPTNTQPRPGQPGKVLDLWAFVSPYLSVSLRLFLSLAFFCRLCTRLAQASQYFARLERGTKATPHSAHRFTLALRNISASSALPCGIVVTAGFPNKGVCPSALCRGHAWQAAARCALYLWWFFTHAFLRFFIFCRSPRKPFLPHSCGVSRCWYADLLRAKLTRSDFWTFCPEVAALWRASPAGNISFGRSFTCACPSMN